MTLIVEAIRTVSPLTGTDFTNPDEVTSFLVDNIGDILTVEIDVRVEVYRIAMSQATTNEEKEPRIVLGTGPANNGRVTDLTAIWVSDTGTSWENFFVGNQIKVVDSDSGNDGTYNILEILDDDRGTQTLITDHIFTPEILEIGAYVANVTDITAITHRHGLIGNDEPRNYISKVDGSEQIAQLGGVDNDNLVYQDATLLGNKSWQSGSIQIKGNGTGLGNTDLATGVVQAFTIKHEFIISPLMLADEWQDILDGIKPDILLDEASLRYVFSIDAAPILKNPNQTTNVEFGEFTGNVGARNENFNGGPTNYSLSNVVYSRIPSGEITGSLELTTNDSKITFTVTNTIDSPFSNGNTQMIFGYDFAPSDENQYRDINPSIQQTMEFNFMFDNVQSTLGSGSGTPDKFGTSEQVIKTMTATRISDSVIEVESIMALSTENITRLAGLVDRRYRLWFTTANHTLLRKDSDKVNLTVTDDEFFNDLSDPTMLTSIHTFIEHTGSIIGTDDKTLITARAEDDIANILSFTLNKATRIDDEIKLTSATAQIIARKDANTFFVLDEYTTNLDLTSITDATYGDIPFVDITEDRGFSTPADDLRKNVSIQRRTDLDAAGAFAYQFVFPVVLRWEDWEPLVGANDEFFDTNQPNNGKNNDWMRISDFSGWDIFFRTIIGATKNGNGLAPFTKETQIFTEDYLQGAEWDTENEKTFIDSTNDPIFDSPNYGVSLKENTRFEGEMTFIGGGAAPTLPDLVDVVKINVFERGNFKEQFTASTLYPLHINTKWLSIVTTDEGGNVWRVAAVIDHTKLADDESFKITHRRYDTRDEEPDPIGAGKELSQGGFKNPSGATGIKAIST